MSRLSEKVDIQNALVHYLRGIGWDYLPPDDVLQRRAVLYFRRSPRRTRCNSLVIGSRASAVTPAPTTALIRRTSAISTWSQSPHLLSPTVVSARGRL